MHDLFNQYYIFESWSDSRFFPRSKYIEKNAVPSPKPGKHVSNPVMVWAHGLEGVVAFNSENLIIPSIQAGLWLLVKNTMFLV